jgi:hypothetical protein
MKAIVVHQYGGPDVLKFEDYPDPVPGPGPHERRLALRRHWDGELPHKGFVQRQLTMRSEWARAGGWHSGGLIPAAGRAAGPPLHCGVSFAHVAPTIFPWCLPVVS